MTAVGDSLNDPYRRSVLALMVGLSFALLALSLVGRATIEWGLVGDQLVVHGWVLTWLMVVTYGLRSLGLLDVLRFWFLGYFVVAAIAVLLGRATGALLGDGSELQIALAVPLVEETAKLLPIVVFVAWLKPKFTLPTLTDIVVGAFAVGAAFAFREDLVRGRLAADGFDGSFWGMAFPSTLHEGARFVAAHGGWSIVAAVGVGLVATHRVWWAYLVAGLGWALAVFDHSAVNSRGELSDELNSIMLDGNLVAAVLVVAVVGAVVHDTVVLRRAASLDDRFSSWLVPSSSSVAAWYSSTRYRHLLVGARLHAWRDLYRDQPVEDRRAMVGHLADLEIAVREPPSA